jgi:mRNA interferase MazF
MAGALIERGQFVVVAMQGDHSKPRPAIVVQSNLFAALPSVAVCPLTTTLRDGADLLRLDIEPSPGNGLRAPSQIIIDKITTVAASKIGGIVGAADDALMLRINRALAVFLGLV